MREQRNARHRLKALLLRNAIPYAGKTWRVAEVEEEQKAIFVTRTKGGKPPVFMGGFGRIHTRVRQRMRELLSSSEVPPYLDATARRFLAEGRENYAARSLPTEFVVDQGRELLILTWLGDSANEAIACLLLRRGFNATPAGPGVEVEKRSHTVDEILDALIDAAVDEPPPLDALLADVKNLKRQKWDWALPDPLLRRAYASLYLDLSEAVVWANNLGGARSKSVTTSGGAERFA